MGTYVSETYSIPAGKFIRRRAWWRLKRYVWLPAGVMAATAVAGFFDVRFLFVLLIEAFILLPGAMALVVLSESLSPDSLRETTPHKVEVSDAGIILYGPKANEKYNWNDFAACQDAGKCVYILWHDRRRAPLSIPEEAFDRDQWVGVATILARNLITPQV